jgi:hypothetical protein
VRQHHIFGRSARLAYRSTRRRSACPNLRHCRTFTGPGWFNPSKLIVQVAWFFRINSSDYAIFSTYICINDNERCRRRRLPKSAALPHVYRPWLGRTTSKLLLVGRLAGVDGDFPDFPLTANQVIGNSFPFQSIPILQPGMSGKLAPVPQICASALGGYTSVCRRRRSRKDAVLAQVYQSRRVAQWESATLTR